MEPVITSEQLRDIVSEVVRAELRPLLEALAELTERTRGEAGASAAAEASEPAPSSSPSSSSPRRHRAAERGADVLREIESSAAPQPGLGQLPNAEAVAAALEGPLRAAHEAGTPVPLVAPEAAVKLTHEPEAPASLGRGSKLTLPSGTPLELSPGARWIWIDGVLIVYS